MDGRRPRLGRKNVLKNWQIIVAINTGLSFAPIFSVFLGILTLAGDFPMLKRASE